MTENQPKQYVEPLHLCPKCGGADTDEQRGGTFRFVAAPGGGLWACDCGASWRTPNWVLPVQHLPVPLEDDAEPVLPNLTDDATQTEALNLLVTLQSLPMTLHSVRMLAAIHNKLYDEWAEPVDVPGVNS